MEEGGEPSLAYEKAPSELRAGSLLRLPLFLHPQPLL